LRSQLRAHRTILTRNSVKKPERERKEEKDLQSKRDEFILKMGNLLLI
jgi:hypothetical protein